MQYVINKIGRVGQILPIPTGSLALTLEKNMMYLKQNAQFYPNLEWARVRLYKIKTGRFPWGMVETVKRVFEEWTKLNVNDMCAIKDNIPITTTEILKNLSIDLRDYQKDAIVQLVINNGGVLCLPTGAGKTFTAIEYLKIMNKKALVITTTLDIMNMWKKQVPTFVDVVNYHKIPKNYDMLKDYEIFVFDEAHHASAKTIYNISMKCGNGILVGLTATPVREDGETLRVVAAIGETVYNIDRRSLIDRKYLADAEVKYISYNNHTKDRFSSYQQIYKDYIVNNDDRNDSIIYCVKRHNEQKILILVQEIEQGNTIKGLLDKEGIVSRFLHGSIKDREIKSEDRVIIGTAIFDEGINIPDFEVLVLAGGGKSSIKVTQRIGRVLRPKKDGRKCIIYDFKDESRYLSRHYKRRRQILEEDFPVMDI